MVSFYRLKYTNFISSDNYLVGHPHEINPESRFLALGARKGYVIADLNYSSFLARRSSLFLFGSLVRRSHPAVSFGYRFYDYEDLFSEFSSLSLSYVRDWIPGLLTNYKVLFRTALKEEGALRRIGFFFQFPDILLMFGANDSIGFIVNEARAIRIPTIVTGDTSISFSRITYMLLSNYKSFKSTVFFVKLFLDLNAEALRFRTLRHYSIFKRFIKSIFLRRTLKSKLSSMKLSRMFFIFRAVPGLRVSQVTPVVYKGGGWRSARFFKVSAKHERPEGRSVMRRLYEGYIDRLVPTSRKEYILKRRILLSRRALLKGSFRVASRFHRDRSILTRAIKALPRRRVPLNSSTTRLKKAAVLRQGINRVRLLRRKRAKVSLIKSLAADRPKRLHKLLTVAGRKGLRVERLLKKASLLLNRLRLNKPRKGRSYGVPLPIHAVRRSAFRQLFPFFGYFVYGYMAKRLNTLFFYRAIFRQIIQKRKRILRLKGFISDLKVISAQAKKFRALNLAINRRRSSIWKLRARVKKFGRRLGTLSKLSRLHKHSGFNKKLYIKKLLERRGSRKPQGQEGGDKLGKKGWADRSKASARPINKVSRNGADKHYGGNPRRLAKVTEAFAELMVNLNEHKIPSLTPKDKPKWLRDLDIINKEKYRVLRKISESEAKVPIAKEKGSKLITKLTFATLTGTQRALVVRSFTPAQRHMLRLYRILSVRYPSFIRRTEASLSLRRRAFLFPRTLRQYLIKSRRLKSEAFRKRTGKVLKFRKTIESLIPKPFKHRGPKHRGGKKPWHKNRGKNFSDFGRDFKKPYYDSNYSRGKGWSRGGKALYNSGYSRGGDLSKKSYYNPDYRNKDRYGEGNKASHNLEYRSKGWLKRGGNVSDRARKDWPKGSNVPHNSNYRDKDRYDEGKRKDGGRSRRSYDPDYDKGEDRGKRQGDSNIPYRPGSWGNKDGGRGRNNVPPNLDYKKGDRNYTKGPYHRPYYGNEDRYKKYGRRGQDGNEMKFARDKGVINHSKKPHNTRYKGGDGNNVPYGLNRSSTGNRHLKGRVSSGRNVQDTRFGKDIPNQSDYHKKGGKDEEGVVAANSEFSDVDKKKGKIGTPADKGPQDGDKG